MNIYRQKTKKLHKLYYIYIYNRNRILNYFLPFSFDSTKYSYILKKIKFK